jgi:hypothetical protein
VTAAPPPPAAILPARFGLARADRAGGAQRLAAALSVLVLAVALIPPLAAAVGLWGLLPMAVAWLVWTTYGGRPRLRAGDITVQPSTLVVRTAGRAPLTLPRDSIVGGVIVPGYGGFDVEVELRDGRALVLEAATLTEAERALGALGVDADKRRSRVPLLADHDAARDRSMAWLLCLAPLSLLLSTSSMPWGILALLVATFGALSFRGIVTVARRTASVTVGLDGIEIPRGGATRFVSLADVADVHLTTAGVEIADADGERTLLLARRGLPEDRVKAVVLRIREALDVRRRRGGAARVAALARGDRSVADWRRELRALAKRGGGYRAAAPSREELVDVLDDPTASAERRVGAALALAGTAEADPAARERLRVAADTCASPRLRVALDGIAAAAADDAAIEAALAEEEAGAAEAHRGEA